MIEQAKTTPTFFMTYESLINEPEKILTNMFCFLLGVKTLEGTLAEAQIKKVTAKKYTDPSMQVYKLKETTGKFCSRKDLYSEEHLTAMNSQLREYMHFFGYASHPTEKSPY